MEFKIISDIENPLFNRREIEGEIHTDVTPSRDETTKILAEKFSIQQDTIKIRTIKGSFGARVFIIVANIYKSKKEKDEVELKKKKDLESEKKAEESTPTELSKPQAEQEFKSVEQSSQENSEISNQENPKSKGEANK